MRAIRTVGHSNHPIDRFVGLLESAGVDLLVDVRSTPYSRRFPQFGRERLAASLRGAAIDYVHEGAALGGKPADGGDYDALASRPDFRDALDRLAVQARDRTVCLMCAEKEPLACHRTVLVARRLAERGIAVEHLLADGRIEPHAALEEKVLAGNGGADLFDDRATRLAQAWRAREIAMRRG